MKKVSFFSHSLLDDTRITSHQSSVSHENKIAVRIFEAEQTTSVCDRGHQFHVTQIYGTFDLLPDTIL